MSRKTRLLFILAITLLLISLLAACAAPAVSTQAPTSSAAAATISATVSSEPTTPAGPVKPQGDLVAGMASFGNENFLPWQEDTYGSQLCNLVYDMLIYWDEINLKCLPGLAESWEVSSDAMTTTYHLRKGVQFHEGYGEFTSADVKYTFEKMAKSPVGMSISKQIKSMDATDPYTLVVNMKKPQPTFFVAFSAGNGGAMQGIACMKYVETVGEKEASQNPIGTGPFKLVDKQSGSFFKFEAIDTHWRVVPEFKTLTLKLIPETSTRAAALKTKEIDAASMPSDQLAALKASGVAAEASIAGGALLGIVWGGVVIPEDDRYDPAYHNKDPWVDLKVRKAMRLAIDSQAICNTVFFGSAYPTGATLFSPGMNKYLYSYDPAAAKQLLAEAGYPNGFSFKLMSYELRGIPEIPRMVEALAGYWQQIGLKPKISTVDYAAYSVGRNALKIAGEISVQMITLKSDMLDTTAMDFMPGGLVYHFQDEGSYAIWKEGAAKINIEDRIEYIEKLNQYFYDNYYGRMLKTSFCYAWNSEKIAPWPHSGNDSPTYFEFVRHAKPINTFRLYSPWPDR